MVIPFMDIGTPDREKTLWKETELSLGHEQLDTLLGECKYGCDQRMTKTNKQTGQQWKTV